MLVYRLSQAQAQQQMVKDLRQQDVRHEAALQQLAAAHEEQQQDNKQQYDMLKSKYLAR